MSRPRTVQVAAAVTGTLAFLAGAISLLRRRRLRGGGRMQEIKEVARRAIEDPWRGKLEEVLELVDDSYVGRAPGLPEPIRGKEGLREFLNAYMTAFPDGSLTVDEIIAEGDLVAARWTARGTNTGELMGIPATGRQVTITGMTFSRIVDGKLREDWNTWDSLSMMQQLGAVPEMSAAATRA
jgi:steroid delta-isomerase-like uncharacterized protein